MSDEAAQKPGEAGGPEKKPATASAGKGVRRPGSGITRKAPGASDVKAPGAVTPHKADTLKLVMMGLCALLFVGCVGVGAYILFFKPAAPVKNVKLSPEAEALAKKADRAKQLYKDGIAKANSAKLEELQDAEKNLFDALNLFNEVADAYQTVPGHEEDIRFAHDKKLFIDAELKKVRDKRNELEMQLDRERREKNKVAQPSKPAEAAPPPPVTTLPGKEPTDEELSDKNLDKLFNDDPSEYERLAKIRESKDKNFKMKKP